MIAIAVTVTSRAVLFALALIVLAAPVQAQQPSASAIAIAREIIAVKGSANIFDTVLPNLIERSKTMLLQTNPLLGQDLNEVAAKLRTELAPRRLELLNDMAKNYAAAFSETELREALAFYKSPLGKKISTVEPQVLEQTFDQVNAWTERVAPEVLAKIRAEMKKKGHDL
jgi:hypothetical protein